MKHSISQKKIFREFNSLVTLSVHTLLSRNFCQKCVRVNIRIFHFVTLQLEFFREINFTFLVISKSQNLTIIIVVNTFCFL